MENANAGLMSRLRRHKIKSALVGDEFEEVVITGNNLLSVQSGPAALCEMKDRPRRRSRVLRTIITRQEETSPSPGSFIYHTLYSKHIMYSGFIPPVCYA